MRIVIIGSGNVATVLGRRIKNAGHEILQVISTHLANAKVLASALNCTGSDAISAVDTTADIYIIAVADTALNQLSEDFHVGDKLVVHTAGAAPKDILRNVSVKYGVLYPLQSLRKEMDVMTELPLLIDGNTEENIQLIENFAFTISPMVSKANDEQRVKLHIGAVIANNFSNHLFSLTEEYCQAEGVDFKMLIPVIKETAQRLDKYSPADMQTGPAIRNDILTLDKHLRLLTKYPRLKYIYLKITDSIMNR